MGRTALRKHIQSKKHLSIEASRTSQPSGLFQAWVSSAANENASSSSTNVNNYTNSQNTAVSRSEVSNDLAQPSPQQRTADTQANIGQWVSNEKVLKAEAMWVLNCAVNHHSCRSNEHTSAIFECMFPDSGIAKVCMRKR